MSFGDDIHEHEVAEAAPAPTCLVYRCRRCSSTVTETHADPEAGLRRAIEAGQLATLHECQPDSVLSVADLIGVGPGKPREYRPTAEPTS